MILERQFLSAAIIYLSPLAVVFFLLFGLVMLSTSDPDRIGRFGYSTSTVLTNATALLCVVLLAHVQLRLDLPASGLVYLEKLYIFAYVLLLLVAMNAFLFSKLSRSLESAGAELPHADIRRWSGAENRVCFSYPFA